MLAVVAVAAVLAGLGGLLVPAMVRRLPEPDTQPREGEPPKPLYAELADRPGLAARSACWSAAVGAVVGAAVGWDWWLVVLVPLVPVGVCLAYVDWHTRLLPTRIVLPATGLVLVAAVVGLVGGDVDGLVRTVAGLLAARSFYWLLWRVNGAGMGFGDVRLAALLGGALGHVGWGELVAGMYAGFLVFGLPGLVLAVVRRDRAMLKKAFPFGPSMLVGALLGLVVGSAVWGHLAGG
ncbi:MAG TPA: A24 family peptidase [Nocardioides sp.]|nr:A24 family peptidase [Nocardioides sp.]